jgi:hypothetical protein
MAACGFGCSAFATIGKRAPPVLMGKAGTYGAIAYSNVTSTGNTLITGDCGTYPGSSISGFPPGVCTGTTSRAGTVAQVAKASCLTAYNDAKGLVPTKALASAELAGLTLPPGVYTFPTVAGALSAVLTLNGTSNPNGQFVFQIRTTFSTSVGSKIVVIGGAQACNVYFVMGSSATVSGGATLVGNFLAHDLISVGAGTSNLGTLCALNGGVSSSSRRSLIELVPLRVYQRYALCSQDLPQTVLTSALRF